MLTISLKLWKRQALLASEHGVQTYNIFQEVQKQNRRVSESICELQMQVGHWKAQVPLGRDHGWRIQGIDRSRCVGNDGE